MHLPDEEIQTARLYINENLKTGYIFNTGNAINLTASAIFVAAGGVVRCRLRLLANSLHRTARGALPYFVMIIESGKILLTCGTHGDIL